MIAGLRLWRFTRHSNGIAVNATRWFYFTNHGVKGERRYYVRVGRRPRVGKRSGWVWVFGPVRR